MNLEAGHLYVRNLPSIPINELIRTMVGTTSVGAVMLVFAIALSAFRGESTNPSEAALGQELATGGPGTRALEEGWTWHENSSGGYAIALPSTWKEIDLDQPNLESSIKGLIPNDPALSESFLSDMRATAASGTGFVAIDMSGGRVDRKSITVVTITTDQQEGQIDLDSYAKAALQQYEEFFVPPVEHSRTKIAAGYAEVFEAIGEDPDDPVLPARFAVRYALAAQDKGYRIHFTTLPDLSERYAPIFYKSGESFRLIGEAPLATDGATPGADTLQGNGQSGIGSGFGSAQGSVGDAIAGLIGVVQGQVIDATTGGRVVGATVRIKGSSTSAVTNSQGEYQISKVPVGERRIVASSDRYIGLEEIIRVENNIATPMVFTLSPKLKSGEVRIVLNWGSSPQDLDAHLWLPNQNQSHVYYISERRGSLDLFPFSRIDVDAKEGNGPETITIGKLYEGIYTYSVNQFSSDSSLGDSNAVVRVYSGDSLIHTFEVPKGEGRWWRVLTIDGRTGAMKPENVLTKDNPAPYPG